MLRTMVTRGPLISAVCLAVAMACDSETSRSTDEAGGASATAGASGASGANESSSGGKTSTGGGDVADIPTCEVVHVDEEAATASTLSCSEHGDVYRCTCGEDDPVDTGSVDSCDEALEQACDADEGDQGSCINDAQGACRPSESDSETWLCVCNEGSASGKIHEVQAETCKEAAQNGLFPICAESCSAGTERCEPGPDPLTFVCQCDLYGERTITWGYTCEGLLPVTCEPGNGLYTWGACTGEQGYCDHPELAEPTYTCQCLDGSKGEVTLDLEETKGECGMALVSVCGEDVPPEGTHCEQEYSRGSGSCDLIEDGDPDAEGEGALTFSCECSSSCGGSTGASGTAVKADDCEQALEATCAVSATLCP